MKIIKIILLYIFLFFLFYFESQQIGPITFSQLWKIPLFLFLFWEVLVIHRKRKHGFIKWSYARAAKNLLIGRLSASFVPGIVDFLRYMMFPLMYEYASKKLKSIYQLDKILLGFAQFVIISGIPFVLGIMKSKAQDTFLTEGFNSYSGMFQNSHGASITTATAVLVLLAFIKLKSKIIRYPMLNKLLLVFGVYLIYITFIRTGYAMFVIGLALLYVPKKLSLKQFVTGVVLLLLLVFGFLYLLETNEFFYNRIFDIRNGRQTAVGSGRLVLWQASWDLWNSGNIFEMLFGFGYESLVDYNYAVTGQRVYAHNEIFTQLGQNGILGVALLFGYLVALFKFIRKRRRRPSYPLAIAIFFLYVSLMLTQGGMWFELDIFMALVFVKLEFEQVIFKKTKIAAWNKYAEENQENSN